MTIQFSKKTVYDNEDWDDDSPNRMVKYKAHDGSLGSNLPDIVKASLDVQHTGASSVTQYPVHPDIQTAVKSARSLDSGLMNGARGSAGADGGYRMENYNSAWAATNIPRTAREGEMTGQIPLFNHKSSQARDTVDYLRTSQGSRALVGPMLGMAARDSMNAGRELTPSDSLSSHSAPMVAKLNKNLGTQFADKQTNDLTFVPKDYDLPMAGGYTPIPQEDVEKGRGFARRAFRNRRPAPEAEQGTLF